ncbi:DUF4030 domain-containing protein [Bacillus sp. S2(2024)]|uniref:DUF4030 domain-containing protein n=1 Tax=Bacillus sp. S2(2024) TaxID=3162887 RepID=UPI003D191BB6
MYMKAGLVGLLLFSGILSTCQQSDRKDFRREEAKVMNAVLHVVDKQDFIGASVDEPTKVVDLEIADTEKASTVRKEINKQLKHQGIQPYTVNISQKNMVQVQKDQRWETIQGNLFQGFQEKGYNGFTTQLTTNNQNQLVTLGIHTHLNSSDAEAQDFAKKVEQEIKRFLSEGKLKNLVKSDSYTIVIYNQNNQVLN